MAYKSINLNPKTMITLASGSRQTSGIIYSRDDVYGYWTSATLTSDSRKVQSIDKPAIDGYSFGGYFYNGTMFIDENCNMLWDMSFVPSGYSSVTVTASWTPNSYTLTFNAGHGGHVYPSSKSVTYGEAVGDIPNPTMDGYIFEGWYTEESGGSLITKSTVWTTASGATLYARWTPKPILTLDANGGTVYPTYVECSYGEPIGDLPRPSYSGFFFGGWYTDPTGGDVVDSGTTYRWSGNATVYAHWTADEQYRITFDANGGVASETERFVRYGETIGEMPTCEKYASIFAGWYDSQTGGTEWTSSRIYDLKEDTRLFARWVADPGYSRTLVLLADGGVPATQTVECTYGMPVGVLPSATKQGKKLSGWYIGDTRVTRDTVCEWSGSITASARWVDSFFGDVTDYFGIGSDTLVPISSDGGENHQHVVSYNAPSETPATETSGIWMNPRVTYEVAGNTILDVTIGKGFAGKVYNSGSTHRVDVTGYMIASVEVHAAIGEPVRVTVSAVANEGFTRRSGSETMTAAATDAIKTYRIVANLSPRHRPQDVMNALSLNGFDLQEITTVATCDPVVVAENRVPCASDICHGRIEVSATLADYGDGESFSPNTGWAVVGEPVSRDGVGYKKVSISARKELS